MSTMTTAPKRPPTHDEAVTIANQMEAVGLFERKGKPDSFTYWLPFLYRDALEIS